MTTMTASTDTATAPARPGSAAWVEEHGLNSVMTNRLAQLDLGHRDERIFSIEGDLGDFGGFPFRDAFPGRYVDAGIAEASMVGMAAGLAMRGKIPYLNTFCTFALMRSCEQVRNELCYHNLDVKISGSFGGIQSPFSGPTHHAVEDIAVARSLPNMTVLVPADAVAVYHATVAAAERPGPVFIRLGVGDNPQVYGEDCRFEIGKGNVLRDGGDVTLVVAGLTMVTETLAAAERLAAAGIDARVIDMPSIKPIDRELLVRAARETPLVVTVEEHSVFGGLGGAVAEVIAEEHPVRMKILGVPDTYCEHLGTHLEQMRRYGLDAESIVASTRAALDGKAD